MRPELTDRLAKSLFAGDERFRNISWDEWWARARTDFDFRSATTVARVPAENVGVVPAATAATCAADATKRPPPEVKPLAVFRQGSTATLSWATTPFANKYAIARGDLSAEGPGQYGACLAQGLSVTTFDDAAVPLPGQGLFYVVQGDSQSCGLGSLGSTSAEAPRVNADPASCH